MKITSILVTEHTIFVSVFEQIERALPNVKSVSEVRTLASIVAGLLERHGNAERDLAYAALDHALAERGCLEQLHQEHEEIDQTLQDALRSDSVHEASQFLRDSLAVCRRHFSFEEAMVFPLIERVLQTETLSVLGHQWSRESPSFFEDTAQAHTCSRG